MSAHRHLVNAAPLDGQGAGRPRPGHRFAHRDFDDLNKHVTSSASGFPFIKDIPDIWKYCMSKHRVRPRIRLAGSARAADLSHGLLPERDHGLRRTNQSIPEYPAKVLKALSRKRRRTMSAMQWRRLHVSAVSILLNSWITEKKFDFWHISRGGGGRDAGSPEIHL